MSTTGSMDAGDASSSDESSSAPDSDDEIELEVNDDAVAAISFGRKPAFAVPVSTPSSVQQPEQLETKKENAAVVDDTFGISYQKKVNVRASTNELAEQTPWTREYDRLDQDGHDFTQDHDTRKEDEDDFDFDLTVPDLMPRSAVASLEDASEKSIVAARKAHALRKEEEKKLVASMKAELAESLAKQASGESQNGKGGTSKVGSNGAGGTAASDSVGVKEAMNKAARELFNQYNCTTTNASVNNNNQQQDEENVKPNVEPPPNIRLSIVAGETVGLTSLAEGDEEEEEEEEEEAEEEEEEEEVEANEASTATTSEANVKEQDSESEGEEVVEIPVTKEETKEEELRRLNMEFDRLSVPTVGNGGRGTSKQKSDQTINLITYRQATMKLDDDVADHGGVDALLGLNSNVGVGGTGVCSCFGINGKPVMLDDRKYFLGLAKLKFQPTKLSHGHMLHTIFHSLEGNNVPLGSKRWMDIGFQGCDPATDIRGTGMLGVLQLLFFCERYPKLAIQIHQLSIKTSNAFPLAVTGFHFTLECMRGLRSGIFDGCVKQEGSVTSAMDLLYVAMMYHFYRGWKVRSYANRIESIQHFGPFKDEMVGGIKKNPIQSIATMRKNCVKK